MLSVAGLVFVATVACMNIGHVKRCEPITSYRPYYSTSSEINCDFWGQFVVDKHVDGLPSEKLWKAESTVCEVVFPQHEVARGR